MVHFSVIPVKTGIQDRENETWIPASAHRARGPHGPAAGMTTFWNMFYFYFQSAKLIRYWVLGVRQQTTLINFVMGADIKQVDNVIV
jgi:hypothetical protein